MVPVTPCQNVPKRREKQVELVQRGKNHEFKNKEIQSKLNSFRFGVCCLFVFDSASTSVAENCSYIQNPNFPQSYGSTSTISWTIKKCTPRKYFEYRIMNMDQNNRLFDLTEICTLRLDFETFTTAGPTLTNDNNGCPDTFAVTAVSICTFVM